MVCAVLSALIATVITFQSYFSGERIKEKILQMLVMSVLYVILLNIFGESSILFVGVLSILVIPVVALSSNFISLLGYSVLYFLLCGSLYPIYFIPIAVISAIMVVDVKDFYKARNIIRCCVFFTFIIYEVDYILLHVLGSGYEYIELNSLFMVLFPTLILSVFLIQEPIIRFLYSIFSDRNNW